MGAMNASDTLAIAVPVAYLFEWKWVFQSLIDIDPITVKYSDI
jgi:hypothetical protein